MMSEIIARLRQEVMPPFGLVEGVAEFAALSAPPPRHLLPAAYVMPGGSRPGPNTLATGLRQRVEETIQIVLLSSSLRDARGEAATLALDELYRQLRAALVGFVPRPAWEPLLLGPARPLPFEDGVVAWAETYTSAWLLRAERSEG